MNHIDEGTMHAWLDGALSAHEARDVEAHVAECASCSAALAEARGLIAGASRILTALDDVPAKVTPKRPPAPARAKRQWRAAPWVTGIAAALVLAVGLTTWNRDGGRMVSSDVVAARETDSIAPLVSQSLAEAGSDAAPITGAPAAAPPTSPDRARRAPLESPRQKVAEAPVERDQSRQKTVRTSSEVAANAPPETRAAATQTTGAAAAAAGAERDLGARTDTTRLRSIDAPKLRLERVVVTAATTATPSALDTAAATRLMAGCYRLGVRDEQREGTAIELTKQRAAAAPSARAAPPAAPARERIEFAAPRTPVTIRLDTAQNRTGFIARDQSTEAYLGTWRRIGDSVRVDLMAHGIFTMAGKDRLRCPER